MAQTMHADIIGTDDVAFTFFKEMAERMYVTNLHRRKWAEINMRLCYDHEQERIQIMKALKGKDSNESALEIIDAIRARQEAAKS